MKKSAFSLIELSIVLVVIGILVVGITSGNGIIRASRLNSARSLTQSSPTTSIRGLSLWLDSTSAKSFVDLKAEDGSKLSSWSDLNSQSSSKFTFLQSVSANQPIYKTDSQNSLPMVKFANGGSSAAFMSAVGFPDIATEATVFLVFKSGTTHVSGGIKLLGKAGNLTMKMANTSLIYSWASDGNSAGFYVPDSTPYIISALYTSNSPNGLQVYQNGVSAEVATSTGSSGIIGSEAAFQVGDSANAGNFSIGEIIVYDRSLRNEERTSVETYLSKKWGIILGGPLPSSSGSSL